jgi:hypothetical protein
MWQFPLYNGTDRAVPLGILSTADYVKNKKYCAQTISSITLKPLYLEHVDK